MTTAVYGLFFEAAESMGAFIFFHPHAPTAAERTRSYYLSNLIGNPLETTIAVASVIFGGLLDRYPDLKLCFAHGGGYACYGIGRMDRGLRSPRRRQGKRYFRGRRVRTCRKLYFDCLTHSYTALDYLLKTVSADNAAAWQRFSIRHGIRFARAMGDGRPRSV